MDTKYKPLWAIGLVLLMAAAALQEAGLPFMSSFMGLFFVVFALFKLVDLEGFVNGFAMYDLIARRERRYAYAYPFIELVLGLLYLAQLYPYYTYLATVVVMAVSAAGVLSAMKNGKSLHCACLGSVIKLPLSTVSAIENLGMGAMALYMLLVY